MEIASDTTQDVTRSLATAVAGFADLIARTSPDLLLVLGDRYEILGAAVAAMMARVPIAHLCGGDVTEGAVDEAIRHSITKMAHLHFVTNADAARRVAQMGENPAHIYTVGNPALDRFRDLKPVNKAEFFASLGLSPGHRNALVTFHPVTLEKDSAAQCHEMLEALNSLGPQVGLIFTGTNADPEGMRVGQRIRDFVDAHANAVMVPSLGTERYLSALALVDVVIGNSSSGLCEAPSFGIPTVNIGNRQGSRLRAASVIDCPAERARILEAIERAFNLDCTGIRNPYGDGHAAERIVTVLEKIHNPTDLLHKRFFGLQEKAI
jgi:UDP-N-acetylglucosamine 2-epimerase (non-hydrolysing)/GDP/UDP-N,N'-diacetylbacillosamine 2-epimerase (hydrolysing)